LRPIVHEAGPQWQPRIERAPRDVDPSPNRLLQEAASETSQQNGADRPRPRRQQTQADSSSQESGQHADQKINGAELREYQPKSKEACCSCEQTP
jgi:hypothetical protein